MRIFYIDVGVEHTHIKEKNPEQSGDLDIVIKNESDTRSLLEQSGVWQKLAPGADGAEPQLIVTGKLAASLIKTVGRGKKVTAAAAYWSAAQKLISEQENAGFQSLGIVDLSASGYLALSVDRQGELINDNLAVNPRCGAGSGTNLSRALQKLDIGREQVDAILAEYLGALGREKRAAVSARADRCGVFSSSATVSDKNQGIPLPFALATTLKSEVLKAVKKLASQAEIVYLTGRVFNWQFARNCAEDYLLANGSKKIIFNEAQDLSLLGLANLLETIGWDNFKDLSKIDLVPEETMREYPSYPELFKNLSEKKLYLRLPDDDLSAGQIALSEAPLNIGLDIGSTMAKIVITNAESGKILFIDSYNNHGDTIETVKHIFRALTDLGHVNLSVQNIGITGSGRYQVQKVLAEVYPHLAERIQVLVENYAHARGSIKEAKEHLERLKKAGKEANEEYCLLVDVGGEDTKVSLVSFKTGDLFDNAMNIKCSAGTGSLMDTLRSMFGIKDIREATAKAYGAAKAYHINATCAVFLMENARRLQLEGYPQEEILASCYWAIVENMARTLWPQINFPAKTIALLHGQTMLSDPLPLAVTSRLQEYTGADCYGLVPPNPGHRACLGLIYNMSKRNSIHEKMDLNLLLNRRFERKIFTCRGTSCGDSQASCARSLLSYQDESGAKKFLSLGGCTSVNEMEAKHVAKPKSNRIDAYGELIKFIDSRLPQSNDPNRLVIPRSFAISEMVYFWAEFFSCFNLPVHVDKVINADVISAQPKFHLDICAPLIGAAGQFSRLAQSPHGMILAPQIDFLYTGKQSLGRSCTTNQGGVVIALQFAKKQFPYSRFHLFDISFKDFDAEVLTDLLRLKLKEVFEFYHLSVSREQIRGAIEQAKKKHYELKELAAEKAMEFLKVAQTENRPVVFILGREYILNPGVYDSHAGRLFGDKGVVALPAALIDLELNQEFDHVYWRNPHFILSAVRAIKDGELYKIIKHPGLSGLVKLLETKNKSALGLAYVSTFRCGPDTMILPIMQEITKDIPFLIIQSDAAINELAHLENRVNTYLNQLAERRSNDFTPEYNFIFDDLQKFSAVALDKERDVLYFPTLDDNRMLCAVLRSAGYDCPDNFSDETFDIRKTVKFGRQFVGDTVCAPFAAVLGDTMLAVRDFMARKVSGEFIGKNKIVVFNNKGAGPCRQGQYYEMHRLFLHRELGNFIKQETLKYPGFDFGSITLQFIVGLEENNYNVGLETWVLLQAFQSVIVQAVMHGLYLEGGSRCVDQRQFLEFKKDYFDLKKSLIESFEKKSCPSASWLKANKYFSWLPGFNLIFLFLGTGLYRNSGLRPILKKFSSKWLSSEWKGRPLKIHIEGEAYMRIAQLGLIFNSLVESCGFNSFSITNSPLWAYLEYLLELKIIESRSYNINNRLLVFLLRNILARPLYRATGLVLPEPMRKVILAGREIFPTAKPHGELVPYTGEAIEQLRAGCDLFLNVAPEGCMVSSMGEVLSQVIHDKAMTGAKRRARLQGLFSLEGEIDADRLNLALLKLRGPIGFYQNNK
ncbi:MAG: acyl-CoA dehydratase activase-related protein [Candidatus Buchananbacteria bacterium]|jgi:activator of 2-hydroxyglutaryl-CoA dehydratase/predicted nucleotide-binding protein (sugar kinase/HSP70/actin superfamily)